MSGIRIVAPFRPLPLEGGVHLYIAERAFDWMAAIRMLVSSSERACGCPVHIITDVDTTTLPAPVLQYPTTHRRLMLWTVEACLRYLESDDFDRDTVMLDVDQLIYADLAPFMPRKADLGVLIRTHMKHSGTDQGNPFLNGVQFWPRRSRERLIAFYRTALAAAEALPEHEIVWGGDTLVLWRLLSPLAVGIQERAGLRVQMLDSEHVLESFSRMRLTRLQDTPPTWRPSRAVVDFRGRRKLLMQSCYTGTLGALP